MLRATALGSDGSLWSVCRFGLAVLAGLLAIPAVTSADEYNRAAMAPAALVVHYRGNSAGTGVPQANRVQPIPAYGPGGDYAGARQALAQRADDSAAPLGDLLADPATGIAGVGAALSWLINTVCSLIFGLLVGAVVVAVLHLLPSRKGKEHSMTRGETEDAGH